MRLLKRVTSLVRSLFVRQPGGGYVDPIDTPRPVAADLPLPGERIEPKGIRMGKRNVAHPPESL